MNCGSRPWYRADDHLAQQELDRIPMLGPFDTVRIESRGQPVDRVTELDSIALSANSVPARRSRVRCIARGCGDGVLDFMLERDLSCREALGLEPEIGFAVR